MADEVRLINATPIKKFIENGLNCKDPLKAFGHDAIEILTEIEFAPVVDAVEVVRCKDCEHIKEGRFDIFKLAYCNLWKTDMQMDNYCCFGNRRADHEKT